MADSLSFWAEFPTRSQRKTATRIAQEILGIRKAHHLETPILKMRPKKLALVTGQSRVLLRRERLEVQGLVLRPLLPTLHIRLEKMDTAKRRPRMHLPLETQRAKGLLAM